MNRSLTLLILFALLLGGLSLCVEKADTTVWKPASPATLDDPYFVLERWLPRLGTPVRRVNNYRELTQLPPDAVLLLGDRRVASMGPREVSLLLDWAARGGHLVIEAEQPGDPDPLLEALGIDHHALGRYNAFNPASIPQNTDTYPLGGRTFTVQFQPYQNLSTARQDMLLSLRDRHGLRLLRFNRGRGMVTILSNFDPMTFKRLGLYDHADFFRELLLGKQPARPVWLAIRTDEQNEPGGLVERAGAAIISALLLVIAWIWLVSPRFGPLQADAAPERRQLKEHLSAAGRFLWQAREADFLLERARQRLQLHLQARHPALAGQSAAAQVDALATLTGLAHADIFAALCDAAGRQDEFVRQVRTLFLLQTRL